MADIKIQEKGRRNKAYLTSHDLENAKQAIRSKSYERDSDGYGYFALYGGMNEEMVLNHVKSQNGKWSFRHGLKNEF